MPRRKPDGVYTAICPNGHYRRVERWDGVTYVGSKMFKSTQYGPWRCPVCRAKWLEVKPVKLKTA